jgi:hypothetical protein
MRILGISGQKQSGKDTFAQMIKDKVRSAMIFHFADAIKEEVADACLVSLEEIEKHKQVYRPMLQWWGTEFRRKHQNDDNYWIEQLHNKLWPDWLNIVADVRFPNEVDYIMKQGGMIVRVVRPGLISTDTHASETALNDYAFNHVITNTTLTYLEAQAQELIDNNPYLTQE